MDVDKPLDELVAANRKQRGGRGRAPRGAGGRASVGQRNASNPSSARQKYAGAVPGQRSASAPSSSVPLASKIVISNLPEDVTAAQLKDLLGTTVGQVKRLDMAYNAQGKSQGNATVEFKNPADSTKAYQQYNGRLIDQKRPMKVEIVVDPSRQPAPPLASRLAAAPAAAKDTGAATSNGRGGSTRGGRGGRRGGGAGGRTPKEKPKTAEELDAEMEDYQKSTGAAA